MNRLVLPLLSVLIALVLAHGLVTLKAADDARDASERQECLQRSQTTAIIAVVAPAIVESQTDDATRAARLEAITALGEQADAC